MGGIGGHVVFLIRNLVRGRQSRNKVSPITSMAGTPSTGVHEEDAERLPLAPVRYNRMMVTEVYLSC